MTRVSASEARSQFSELVSRAEYRKDRVIVTRRNSDVAAIISMDELRLLDALLQRYGAEPEVSEVEEEISAARDHAAAIEFLEGSCQTVEITSKSYKQVLELIKTPQSASPALRELMAADGD